MLLTMFVLTLEFILLFFLSRGLLALYITTKIKKNRHRTKRTKGQSFLDWLLYRRFSDVIPKSELLYLIYYANIALYLTLMVSTVVLGALNRLDAVSGDMIGFYLVIIAVPLTVASRQQGFFRKK